MAVLLIMSLTLFSVVFPIFVTSGAFSMMENLHETPAPKPCLDACKYVAKRAVSVSQNSNDFF